MVIDSRETAAGESRRQPMSKSRFWHPFANMATVAEKELVLERGDGVWVWDTERNKYLDGTGGLWYCFVGHGRTELADAAAAQMSKLAAYSAFGDVANRPAVELADRIAEISPIPESVAFFTSGGSESIDTAAKLVRRYWTAMGKPERHVLVTREGAYHGVAGYGTSLAGIQANVSGYGELIPGVVQIPPDDPQSLAQAIERNPGRVAAFFGEPVRGAGGIYPPREGYWLEIQRICRENDVLLVADEVITGFGRLGRWFGSSRYDIVPDIITAAKGLTSGYLPLGVAICGPRVQEPFWSGEGTLFRHGYTYSGHATACAVALANLDLIEKENLVAKAAQSERILASEMTKMREHPLVEEVRCAGLLSAVELSVEARSTHPGLVDRFALHLRKNGVLTRALVGHSLQISPPLTIEEGEIRFLAEAFRTTLNEVHQQIGG